MGAAAFIFNRGATIMTFTKQDVPDFFGVKSLSQIDELGLRIEGAKRHIAEAERDLQQHRVILEVLRLEQVRRAKAMRQAEMNAREQNAQVFADFAAAKEAFAAKEAAVKEVVAKAVKEVDTE
jgi:predicted  nucleic acid-binding Zn-ribbon protein